MNDERRPFPTRSGNPRFPPAIPKTPPKGRTPTSTFALPGQAIRPPAPELDAAAWAKKRHEDTRAAAQVRALADPSLTVGAFEQGMALIRDAQLSDGRAAPLWCDTCQTDDCDCETRTALVTPHDGTGEAAITPDRARADERDVLARLHRRDAPGVLAVFARYEHRAPSSMEKRRVELDNDPGCECCARLDRWEPPHVLASDVKGNLDRLYRLCSWCYGWVKDTGRLPTVKELEVHHDGKHVFRPEHPKKKGAPA